MEFYNKKTTLHLNIISAPLKDSIVFVTHLLFLIIFRKVKYTGSMAHQLATLSACPARCGEAGSEAVGVAGRVLKHQ